MRMYAFNRRTIPRPTRVDFLNVFLEIGCLTPERSGTIWLKPTPIVCRICIDILPIYWHPDGCVFHCWSVTQPWFPVSAQQSGSQKVQKVEMCTSERVPELGSVSENVSRHSKIHNHVQEKQCCCTLWRVCAPMGCVLKYAHLQYENVYPCVIPFVNNGLCSILLKIVWPLKNAFSAGNVNVSHVIWGTFKLH